MLSSCYSNVHHSMLLCAVHPVDVRLTGSVSVIMFQLQQTNPLNIPCFRTWLMSGCATVTNVETSMAVQWCSQFKQTDSAFSLLMQWLCFVVGVAVFFNLLVHRWQGALCVQFRHLAPWTQSGNILLRCSVIELAFGYITTTCWQPELRNVTGWCNWPVSLTNVTGRWQWVATLRDITQ